jgi:hypothetical protein
MRSRIKSMDDSTNTPVSPRKVSRKGEGKAWGTRAGILRDWREASGKTARDSGLRRDAMRDGR